VTSAFTVVKPATYAIQSFTGSGGKDDLFCFADLNMHPALIHSMLFTAQAFRDTTLGYTLNNTAQFHLAKSLRYLQQSLDDKRESTSYPTLIVVTSLASAALMLGDLESAQKHMNGLQRILELRGGLHSLGKGSMLEHKIQSYVHPQTYFPCPPPTFPSVIQGYWLILLGILASILALP